MGAEGSGDVPVSQSETWALAPSAVTVLSHHPHRSGDTQHCQPPEMWLFGALHKLFGDLHKLFGGFPVLEDGTHYGMLGGAI